MSFRIPANVLTHKIMATIDSGAGRTVISHKVVEKYNIPYRAKEQPIRMVLADNSPATYGNGMIRLETESVPLTVAGIRSPRNIDIMDLGEDDMLIGHDWLRQHNPIIDWQ